MSIIIRNETPADYRAVENLTRESFWNVYRPGCTEHYVLHCYRSAPDFVPELDFVMEKEKKSCPARFSDTGQGGTRYVYSRSSLERRSGNTLRYMVYPSFLRR